MEIGPVLWFLMTAGGAALLGVALVYGLSSTSRRRNNPVAQRITDQGTRDVYQAEEARRRREEPESRPDQVP